MNVVIALAIATVKAVLVVGIFMGLKYDSKLNLVIFVSSFFFLMVLFFFSYVDIITRIFQHSAL
jgi:cytochrome c oxidase subunit 4